ncbi:MAG: Gfo/Idh/MocA family oxidoreductase [Kiritimatiellaeota bacterium]|nr:Gfo/Idh/MocA family oxidoreductase [Kiritimatiellota bacterium]
MGKKIRVGIIGAGQIGTAHMRRYSQHPDVEMAAVSDLFPEKIETAQKNFGIPDGYADFADLLERDDIEAVDVCVHNNKHAPITVAALEAGKHVFCEKPMAGTYRDALAMHEAASRHGRKLSIQLGTLFNMQTRAAERLIRDGCLGRIYYARSVGFRRRGRPFVDGYGTANFVNKPICAGGALFDMGVYHIANILYLLDNPEVISITGATHQALDMYEDRRKFSEFGVEELGLGWVRLAGGISFDIEEAWAVHYDNSESSKLLGAKGGIKLSPFAFFSSRSDMPMTSTFDLDGSNTRWHSCFPDTDAYDSPQQHWIAALQGRVPLLPTAEVALNTMLISSGIYLSAELGREVTADEVRKKTVSTAIDPYTPEKVWH